MSRSVQFGNGSKNVLKLDMQRRRSIPNRKYEILAVVAHVPYTTQNLVISRCCFAEEGKGIQRFLTHVLSYCFAH